MTCDLAPNSGGSGYEEKDCHCSHALKTSKKV